MKIKITKMHSAILQLKEAIELFFEERDPVSIHTLSSAALQIINDHIKTLDYNTAIHPNSPYIREEHRKDWIAAMNGPKNFFKHADRDIKNGINEIDFETSVNDYIIYGAINNLKNIDTNLYQNNIIFLVFETWFIYNHSKFFNKDLIASPITNFENIEIDIAMDNKKSFLELLKIIKDYNINNIEQIQNFVVKKSR
jgi:hypothetical protein